ncbi:MAG: hypothetical protein ACR2J3_13520 [Aridibacter sp.]
MSPQKAKETLNKIQNLCRDAVEIAKTASRNNINISGHNFYGNKFHQQVINISAFETEISPFLSKCLSKEEFGKLNILITSLKSTAITKKERINSLKEFSLICQSVVIPKIENSSIDSTPKTEQVLPLAVVKGTKGYFENMIIQANGCYENGWYESCSVMIRKFVENLIIEVFEAKNESNEIKDSNDNFFMLENLINRITAKTSWNLQRDTKKFLPQIKSLGDRAAHNRRYLCTKPDIDKVLSGLRVIADDLLHLANLK